MTSSRRARPTVRTFQMDYLDLLLQEQNKRDKRQIQAPETGLDELSRPPTIAEFRLCPGVVDHVVPDGHVTG